MNVKYPEKVGVDIAMSVEKKSESTMSISAILHGKEQLNSCEKCIDLKLIKSRLPREDNPDMQKYSAIRAKQLEQAVARVLSLLNISYMRVENYRCFKCGQVQNSPAKNWPDFFVYHPFFLAIECKTGSGELTSGQHEIIYKLKDTGADTLIVRNTVDSLLIYMKEKGYSV